MKDKILSALENGGEYVSGEELSKNLGVSRTAVWKNIKALRDEGYIISSSSINNLVSKKYDFYFPRKGKTLNIYWNIYHT